MPENFLHHARRGLPWALALVLAACGRPAPSAAEAPEFSVVAADAGAGTLTLRGAGLPSPAPDGTQVVAVGAGDAAIGYVGRKVRGELQAGKEGWRLEQVWPADPAAGAILDETTRRIRRDTADLGRKSFRDVGDAIPDFALYNQDGQLVQAAGLRGRRLILNFIFTRCANPEMCPAASLRMAQLQKALAAAGVGNVTLVTISFDPAHDTPGVLRQYAQAYGFDLTNYQLLTGPADQINDLMEQFGILRRTEAGVLQHTMATLLVSPEGRIVVRREGSAWRPEEFVERLKTPAPAAGPS